MNRQEIFNKAYIGLAKQGFLRSVKPDETYFCVYRGDNGLRCALGHCIPDETYSPAMEGITPFSSGEEAAAIRHSVGAKGGRDGDDSRWLMRLQACHDRADTPQEVQDELCSFAAENGLTIPEVPA